MQEFKVGQTVRIVKGAAAREYNLDTLGLVGHEFMVKKIVYNCYREADCAQISGNWYVPPEACELIKEVGASTGFKTTFQVVAAMNTAFGNPKGDPKNVNWDKIRSQFKNVFDEYCEGLLALGIRAENLNELKAVHKDLVDNSPFTLSPVPKDFRDAVADIKVFADGCSHLAGYDGDADMHLVVDAVMTRFIKSPEDKEATIALHAAKGVTDVYFEGDYPTMIMKSSADQPDAPRGKFLKSASYSQPVFPCPEKS